MPEKTEIISRKNKPGAGRKVGIGKFREDTSVILIPASQQPVIKDFLSAYQRKRLSVDLNALGEFELPALQAPPIKLPLFSSKVPAGFPSPAEEHV